MESHLDVYKRQVQEKDDANKTYIAAFQVHNPAIFNKSIKDIAHMSYPKFVISRLWRDGNVSIPTSEKIIKEGDRLLVVTSEKDALALTVPVSYTHLDVYKRQA